MNTLMTLKNNMANYIKQNISLFESFDNVYLFGSILKDDVIPNDIDILLIYSEYCYKAEQEAIIISSVLEKDFSSPIPVLEFPSFL